MNKSSIALAEGVIWRRRPGEPGFLLSSRTGEIHGLNRTAAAILDALPVTGGDIDALAARLAGTFDVDPESARADIAAFLGVLRERELV